MSTQESYTSSLQIERRSIDYIPASERHGTPNRLFFIWFGANMQVTAAATGAIAVLIGLSLPWALLALLIGNLFGVTFMAAHSAQGPKLGIPQMIQSRAQFGFYGAIVPLVLVLLMYVGYFAASAILGGAALAAWWGINDKLATVIVSPLCTVLAIYGYRMIHQYERWVSLVSGLGFVYLTIRLLTLHHIAAVWVSGSVPYGTFLLAITLAATWQITYAPYVADYSRYLPEDTNMAATFWWTAVGLGHRLVLADGFRRRRARRGAQAVQRRERDLLHGPGQQPHRLADRPHNHRGHRGGQRAEPLRDVHVLHDDHHRSAPDAGAPWGQNDLRGRCCGDRDRAGDRRHLELPHQLRELHPLLGVLPDPVDGDQPDRLLLRAQGAVRHRLDIHSGRDLRARRLAHDDRLPGRHRSGGPVHEHDLLHRSDGLPPRGRGHLLDPGPDRGDRSLLRPAHGRGRDAPRQSAVPAHQGEPVEPTGV